VEATEKVILKPAVALRVVGQTADDAKGNNGGAGSKGAPPNPQKKKFQFVKNFGVADKFKFEDGTGFQFRLITRNTGGYQPNSFVETDDEKLADNLRAASKNKAHGIVQIR
jgi:hypothetical protein